MLRVGLTGGLGSGKSTAAAMFEALGARILSSDEIGRALMQPGEPVYAAIVERFGPGVLLADGQLDRAALARLAFTDGRALGRLDELNAIVHPAVIDRQAEIAEEIAASDPNAIVIVESALIFETKYTESSPGGVASTTVNKPGWRHRFDKLILVTAPEELRLARFVSRSSSGRALTDREREQLETEGRRRMAQQLSDDQKSALADYVLTNSGAVTELEWQVDRLWPLLVAAAGR